MERETGAPGLLIALVLCLLATGTARAQATQEIGNVLHFSQRAPAVGDARMLGRGGAGRAGIGDATALFYNPAGLAWMKTSAGGGALGFIGTTNEARFDGLTETRADDYGGHAALAYKVPTARGSLVLAGAYNRINAFGQDLAFRGPGGGGSITQFFLPRPDEYRLDGSFIEWTGSVIPEAAYEAGAIEFFPADGSDPALFEPAVLQGTDVRQIGTVERNGRQSEISLGVGAAATRNVMVGLSANFAVGRYGFINRLTELDDGANDDYEVIRNGAVYNGLDEVRFEERSDFDMVGLNLRGGISARTPSGVRMGLTLESPTFYEITETYADAQVTTFFDDGGVLSYGGRVGDAGVGEVEYRVRTPWRLGAGAEVNFFTLTRGVADLSLAADLEFVDWRQLELDSDVDDLGERNLFIDQNRFADDNFGVVINTNLGAELRAGNASFRGGFAYRPDPRDPDSYNRAASSDEPASDRLSYSAGLGYRFDERLQVDFGWMQTQSEGIFTPYDGGPRVTEDLTRDRFLLGVKYFF